MKTVSTRRNPRHQKNARQRVTARAAKMFGTEASPTSIGNTRRDLTPATLRVRVGSKIYTFYFVRGVIVTASFRNRPLLGLCDFDTQRVFISDQMSTIADRRDCFWHELAHAWDREWNPQGLPYTQESLANAVGKGMALVDSRFIRRVDRLLSTPHGSTKSRSVARMFDGVRREVFEADQFRNECRTLLSQGGAA